MAIAGHASLGSLAGVALAAVIAVATGSLGLAACGSFSDASDPADAGAAGADALAAGDSSARADAAARPQVDPASCIDVTTAAGAAQFDSYVPASSGMTAKDGNGLSITYPTSLGETAAYWNHTVTPSGATGATIAIDAKISMTAPLSPALGGYAGFAMLTYGDSNSAESAPSVVITMDALSATQAAFDFDTFPVGFANDADPEKVTTFGQVGLDTVPVHVVFDVTWSAASAANGSAYLGENGAVATAVARTTSPTTVTQPAAWNVALGGAALQNGGPVTITYQRVCIQLH